MPGNAAASGNAMSNAWTATANQLSSFMQTPNQVNGSPGSTGGGKKGKRRRKTKKGSRKAGRKSRRRRKQKVMGFDIF
jgi:hypothetical protein